MCAKLRKVYIGADLQMCRAVCDSVLKCHGCLTLLEAGRFLAPRSCGIEGVEG